MSTLTSVGIQITESDFTQVTQPISSSIGAFVGHFKWGPADQVTSVNSEATLAEIFGAPGRIVDQQMDASFLTAASFLKYGNSLKVVRCVEATARNANYYTSDGDNELFRNVDEFELSSDNPAALYARCPGELGNSLAVHIIHDDNKTDVDNVKFIKDLFSVEPSTTDWALTNLNADANDEIHVVIVDADGLISGTKNTVLETWQGLSLHDGARLGGANNYYADVINGSSQYLFVGNTAEIATDTGTGTTVSYDLQVANKLTFSGGDDGAHNSAEVSSALDIFKDADGIDINLLFAESVTDANIAGGAAAALLGVVAARQDCIAFISAPVDVKTKTSNNSKLSAIKGAKVGLTGVSASNSTLSFAVFDSSPVYVYNRYSDTYVWIPACGHMAGLCAHTDEVADPWFSPAGFNRGQLRGVVKLAYSPTQIERDELYAANINPIISVAGQGIVLFGDKTGQTRPSAFDRINVRRLFIELRRTCALAAKFQLFELNDEFTRNTFINIVEPYLRDVQGRRGILDYKIVCDETNNTAQVIDTNRFVADIFIKPARSINFISLNFIATRTGTSFVELA